jgi:hypothetical protein
MSMSITQQKLEGGCGFYSIDLMNEDEVMRKKATGEIR